jgi:hypothetical protein
MDILVRVLSVLRAIVRQVVSGLGWLARQTYRQRSLGMAHTTAQTPQLTRLLDLHALTVAADLALIAALFVGPAVNIGVWIGVGVTTLALAFVAAWQSSRLVIGLLIAVQGVGAVLAAQWISGGWLLAVLLGLAVAQQAAVLRLWLSHGAKPTVLARATAYGLLLGVFTGGGGLIAGLVAPSIPLWIAALLLTIAAVLTWQLPKPVPPVPQPRKKGQVPDGYAVYRPSSLED